MCNRADGLRISTDREGGADYLLHPIQGDGPVEQVTPEQILTYLNRLTEGNKPYTSRTQQRYWPAPVEASFLLNRFLAAAALDTRPRPDRPVGMLDQSWRFSLWETMRTVQ